MAPVVTEAPPMVPLVAPQNLVTMAMVTEVAMADEVMSGVANVGSLLDHKLEATPQATRRA